MFQWILKRKPHKILYPSERKEHESVHFFVRKKKDGHWELIAFAKGTVMSDVMYPDGKLKDNVVDKGAIGPGEQWHFMWGVEENE